VKNKLVLIDEAKNPIKKSPGFEKKGLANYHLELCGLCGFGCSYCSTNAGTPLRINRERFATMTEQQLGIRSLPAEDPALMFIYPNILAALGDQLARVRPEFGIGKTLVVSMLTDPLSPELIKDGTTMAALQLVLEKTSFRIRLLTKNAIVAKAPWLPFFEAHRDRFVVGLSVGTIDDTWAKEIEAGTSTPSARLRALRTLQYAGVSTFGMACPVFPDRLEQGGVERLVDLIRPDVVEEFWAEPYNDRTNWERVRGGYVPGSAGYDWFTNAFERRRHDVWSAYATELYSRLRDKALREGWIDKLKYLLYEGHITEADAAEFAGLRGVLLQRKVGSDGKTTNPYLHQWDTRSTPAGER